MAKAALQTVSAGESTRVCDFVTEKLKIDLFLQRIFEGMGNDSPSPVTSAMEYAVMGDAQRVRPMLALRLARMLRCENEHTLRAAAAVEILHSASLIVDDLPSMDNELMRRGRPCAHVRYGEAVATLAAFSLVGLAARIVMEVPASEREFARLRRFQLALLRTLDVSSLVGGQSLDLELAGKESCQMRETMRETMNDLKTVPLFHLAVEAACVGLPLGIPADLACFGRHFGLAFQLTDDYLDGEIADTQTLYELYDRCRETLAPYGAQAEPIHELVGYLESRLAA